MAQDNKVVPFGKYRGQPVELLLADQKYLEWLRNQPWFEANYRDIYNVIINYGSEPQDSPEHNKLQALFLDDEYCLAFAKLLRPDRDHSVLERKEFEYNGIDVYIRTSMNFTIEIKPSIGDDYPSVLRQIRNNKNHVNPVLFLGTYIGVGVTKEQFISIFNSAGIDVVFRNDHPFS